MSTHAPSKQSISTPIAAAPRGPSRAGAPPGAEPARSFADLERAARAGHRLADVPTHAPGKEGRPLPAPLRPRTGAARGAPATVHGSGRSIQRKAMTGGGGVIQCQPTKGAEKEETKEKAKEKDDFADFDVDFDAAFPAPVEVGIDTYRISKGDIHTKGLANCIAVAAHDTGSGDTLLYHYDTSQGSHSIFTEEEDGEDDDGNQKTLTTVVPAKIVAMKNEIDGLLKATGTVDYHIVLGGMWEVMDKRTKAGGVEAMNTTFAPKAMKKTGQSTATWSAAKKTLS
jgi:hypothetical protein